MSEDLGFAALNVCHARKFFPPIEEIDRLAEEVCRTMAEVREVRRLGLDAE